jgi:deoxycytidine triphosphate deaminase
MVLSDTQIKARCFKTPGSMIDPFVSKNLKAASYDLTLGGEYSCDSVGFKNYFHITILKEGKTLHIPPNATCCFITKEKIRLPRNITATISLRMHLIMRGLILSSQPPGDPGFEGKLPILLHNLSNRAVSIKYGETIITIAFYGVTSDEDILYNGDYRKTSALKDYLKQPLRGSVFQVNKKLRRIRTRFINFIPTIITILTIFISILSVVVAFSPVTSTVRSFFNNPNNKVNTESTIEIRNENTTITTGSHSPDAVINDNDFKYSILHQDGKIIIEIQKNGENDEG